MTPPEEPRPPVPSGSIVLAGPALRRRARTLVHEPTPQPRPPAGTGASAAVATRFSFLATVASVRPLDGEQRSGFGWGEADRGALDPTAVTTGDVIPWFHGGGWW